MENQNLRLTKSEALSTEVSSSVFSREWQTLAGGISKGASLTGSTTVENLKQAGSDFMSNPLSATANYVCNHFQDVVAGAAITFMRPGRLANAALAAYSLRGTAYATYDAFTGALDPKADISKLTDHYAKELSEQGTAFISSMPAALAGGNLGRAGANAVFGKNLGGLDYLAGKIPKEDVSANLWKIRDTLNPPKVKLLITDMDNTLASHGKYFSTGVEKAITELSAKTKIPESELNTLIGNEMEKARSHDYPWSVEIALQDRFQVGKPGGMSVADFHDNIVKPFWKTLDESMSENFKAFPGVESTLQELKAKNIHVAVLSDAPAYIGLKRLETTGISPGLVDRFYGLHNWHDPVNVSTELAAHGYGRVESMLKTPHQLSEFRPLPHHWEKPDTNGFEALMRAYNVRPAETLMIGDSRVKDVGVAHRAGSRAIWAKYGTPLASEEAILARLRPAPENSGGVAPGTTGKPKQYAPYLEAAESFTSVLNHLEPKVNIPEIARQTGKSLLVRPEFSAALGAYALLQPQYTTFKESSKGN